MGKTPRDYLLYCSICLGKILGVETMGSFSSLAKNSSKPMGGGVLSWRGIR